MKTHELKIWPVFFQAVIDGTKTFEVRNNNKHFKIGDILNLREYDFDAKNYTGRECEKKIVYILDDNSFQSKNMVVLGLYSQQFLDKDKVNKAITHIFDNTKRIHKESKVIDWVKVAIHKSAEYLCHADKLSLLKEEKAIPKCPRCEAGEQNIFTRTNDFWSTVQGFFRKDITIYNYKIIGYFPYHMAKILNPYYTISRDLIEDFEEILITYHIDDNKAVYICEDCTQGSIIKHFAVMFKDDNVFLGNWEDVVQYDGKPLKITSKQ
jgi:hypothetical protein